MRRKPRKLSRQLALGLLQDAMGRVEERRAGPDPIPEPAVTYEVIARVPAGSLDGTSAAVLTREDEPVKPVHPARPPRQGRSQGNESRSASEYSGELGQFC
jgi:hypothetical protein